jgi:hypothetical protein
MNNSIKSYNSYTDMLSKVSLSLNRNAFYRHLVYVSPLWYILVG